MNTIGGKVESAFAQVIESLDIANLSIYQGTGKDEKAGPCVIIVAGETKDDAPSLGVWHVSTRIMVKSVAGDSEADASDELAQQIFNAVTDDNIADLLSEAEPTLCVLDSIYVSLSSDIQQDVWITTLELDVVAVHAEQQGE